MTRAVVVLPSTTYRAGDFVSAAESLGIDLVVASEQPPPFDMGDRYLQIDCSDPAAAAEAIVALGDDVALDGVIAADDAGVGVAAMAASRMGLPGNHPEAAAAAKDKLLMRRRLEKAEVPQPQFAPLGPDQDARALGNEIGYPLIVKPRDRSASQGVIRVDSPNDLDEAVRRVRAIVGDSATPATLLIESYLPGDEVAVEGMVREGELTVLALFDKPDTSSGPVFPETIFVTPSRLDPETQTECVRVATAAVTGIGLSQGPVHIELRTDRGKAGVVELAARSIGGLCSRSLSFGLMGTTLEALILRNAVGMDKPELRRENQASGVLMIPIPRSGTMRNIEGLDGARSIPGITGLDMTARVGDDLLAPPEGDRYLGFVYARSQSPEAVESALRKAKDTIRIEVA